MEVFVKLQKAINIDKYRKNFYLEIYLLILINNRHWFKFYKFCEIDQN